MKDEKDRIPIRPTDYILVDASFSKWCNDTPWVDGVWVGNDGKCYDSEDDYTDSAVKATIKIIKGMMEEDE